jgi:energy-coupling factor transporter ATP-binding protein EcfA2
MRSFRGVPGALDVDFGAGQSIAVYGDNGTGKSTIADALEWFFTGAIELLSHEGRQHAIRNLGGGDGETSVEVVTSGQLGGKAVFPDERAPEAFGVAARETFLLRGRTLADFINKTKTEKWKALAELLGLDAVELLRQDLQRARGELRKQLKAAEERIAASRGALGSGDAALGEADVLATLQQFCRALGVDVPESLDAVADPSWLGAVTGESRALAAPKLETLSATVAALCEPALDDAAVRGWNALVSSERAAGLSRLALLREADALLAKGPHSRCPVCGQKVTAAQLASQIREALAGLLESAGEMDRAREAVDACDESLAIALEPRRAVAEQARALRITLPELPARPKQIRDGIERRQRIELPPLQSFAQALAAWDVATRLAIRNSLPADAGTRQSQLGMLALLCEHVRAWRQAELERARAQKALAVAEAIYDAYSARQKRQLEEMLGRVSQRVADIYVALHPGENLSGITVEPWTAKGLELAVEFHGQKQRPPHGVLSESHLNSLAIALFLAMAQTFNQKLRFLVLDDVINSFDLEHRGELASLLAEKFDDWQLVVLTHDRQFFDHLVRRAPSWKRLEITSWSYEQGPRTTGDRAGGTLAEAQERLAQGDASGAATRARRGLEELLQEVCEALQAALPFRRGAQNDQREIGELLRGLRRAVKEHAKAMTAELEPLLKHLEADVQATLNVEAHASRGRSGAAEVEAALRRVAQLDRLWSCPDCGTRVWHKGTPEASRCRCGKRVFPPPPS